MSWKAGTRDKRKLPDNVEDVKFNFMLRLIWLVDLYTIHPSLCVNMDETGQNLFPSQKKSWSLCFL
jgi:hypothetical protein